MVLSSIIMYIYICTGISKKNLKHITIHFWINNLSFKHHTQKAQKKTLYSVFFFIIFLFLLLFFRVLKSFPRLLLVIQYGHLCDTIGLEKRRISSSGAVFKFFHMTMIFSMLSYCVYMYRIYTPTSVSLCLHTQKSFLLKWHIISSKHTIAPHHICVYIRTHSWSRVYNVVRRSLLCVHTRVCVGKCGKAMRGVL